VTGCGEHEHVAMYLGDLPLLRRVVAFPALTVDGGGGSAHVNASVFEHVCSFSLRSSSAGVLHSGESDPHGLPLQSLRLPALQSAMIEVQHLMEFKENPHNDHLDPIEEHGQPHRAVLRALVERHSDRFAFETRECADRPGSLQRLAWRKWPRRGSRDWQAAVDAHAQAVAWADEPHM